MSNSKIEWTEQTWNPITGCTKISAGCKNCYAETMAKRLQVMGAKGYENGFSVTIQGDDAFNKPLMRKKPTTYFVCSMSDLFHEALSDCHIDRVIEVIERCPQHTFQILTKRAERMAEFFKNRAVPENVQLGVTVENQEAAELRIPFLLQTNAKFRFLSIEPMLQRIKLDRWIGEIDCGECRVRFFGGKCPVCEQELDNEDSSVGFAENSFDKYENIDLVIVGGESGNNARPMKKDWVLDIKQQCEAANTQFFFKQWGTHGEDGVKRNKKANGRMLDGCVYGNN